MMLNTLRSSFFASVLLTSFGTVCPTIGFVNRINFGPSIYLSQDFFYLGARSDATDPLELALARARKNVDIDTQAISLCVDAIAPERALVNYNKDAACEVDADGNELKNEPVHTKNPIFNKGIAHIALRDRNPVVVLATDDTEPMLGPLQKLCLVANEVNGNTVLTNTTPLPDANGNAGSGIADIAASTEQIFAAVAASGGNFGDAGSGITLVRTHDGKLEPVGNATNLSLGAGELVAISQDGVVGQVIDLHYSNALRRLYVALRVTRSDESLDGGGVALLVGRLKEGRLELAPAVDLDPSNFATNSTDFIIGFNADGGNALGIAANLHKVRTLRTTTGVFYSIINGTVTDDDAQNVLYALPLVHEVCNEEGKSTNAESIGRIASKANKFQVASGVGEMTLATDAAAMVGAGPLPSTSAQTVHEVFTAGDTVFVCLAGRDDNGVRDTAHESGIFASAAILNADGKIACWQPWQRVMGSTARALGGGIEAQTGSFMYLSGLSSTTFSNLVETTLWGSGDGDDLLGGPIEDSSKGLVTLLCQEFPSACGGVEQLFDFNDNTPSFAQAGTVGSIALQVATGFGKVVLVETGRKSGAAQNLTPNTEVFTTHTVRSNSGFAPERFPNTRAMAISGGVLDELGPLCTAEISRVPRADAQRRGWLFVAGHNGLAVLSTNTGDGWDTALDAGLSSGLEGLTQDMSFKRVGNFRGVRKIVSDSEYLYVLTAQQLARITLSKNNFSTDGAASPQVTLLADACSVTSRAGTRFLDVLLASKLALLATGDGLYRLDNGCDISGNQDIATLGWREVITQVTCNSLGTVGHLATISKTGSDFSSGGNLYAVANNLSSNLTCIHRFVVADTSNAQIDDDTVLDVPEASLSGLWAAFGQYRASLTVDGATGLTVLPQNFGSIDYLRGIKSGANLVTVKDRGVILLPVAPPECVFNVGIVRRSSASGAWIIPGNFGIAVNE